MIQINNNTNKAHKHVNIGNCTWQEVNISMKHLHQGRVKWKLALHGLAAYLLNGLQRSSNAAVDNADVNKDGGR